MKQFKTYKKMICLCAFTIIVFSTLLGMIIYQENNINKACEYIEKFETQSAIDHINKVFSFNIDYLNNNGETMLISASKAGNVEIIKYLLEKGANPNFITINRLGALESYCSNGYKNGKSEGAKILLENGASATRFGYKPALMCLAEKYYYMNAKEKYEATLISEWLIAKDSLLKYNGTTVLHLAAKSNMSKVVDILLRSSSGSKLLLESDSDGKTPWKLSIEYGAVGVQQVIRSFEKDIVELERKKEEKNKLENNTGKSGTLTQEDIIKEAENNKT